MVKWLALLFALIACPAKAELPFLDSNPTGTTPVTVIGSTITVSGGSLDVTGSTVTVTASEGTFFSNSVYGVISGDITVSGGSGFALFTATGTFKNCSIKAPTEAAVYDFEIVTEDAQIFPIISRTRLRGSGSLMAPRIMLGVHRIKFDNTVPDGNYRVRCGFQE